MTANLAVLGLFQRYGTLRAKDVTPDIVREIAKAMKMPATEEGIVLAAQTVAGGDLESLADYIGQPDRLKKIASLLNPGSEDEQPLVRCPHCRQFFELKLEAAQH